AVSVDTNGLVVEQFARLVELALAHGINLHDPRYVGLQVPAPVPLAGLFDCIGAVINNPMAIYEMGPWVASAEQALIAELAGRIGWEGRDSGGIVTHGGSIANLTAILVARNVALGRSWELGIAPELATRGGRTAKLVVHADAHYCLARAAGITGIGTDNVVLAPLDDRRRIDPSRLDETLVTLRSAGHPIIAVSACACSTPVGAFDPLIEIAEVCQRHDVWLHVDAAHGGAALFSRKHCGLLAGIDLADSVTWDAHKMMFVPALCAFLLYKDKRHSYEAFRQNAPYLFDPSEPGLADFDGGLRTLECTKRAAALGLWGVWSLFGPELFEDLVDVTFALGRSLYEQLNAAADFTPLHEPQCNIVVFRYTPSALRDAAPAELGEFQLHLRRSVIESGDFYLVPTSHNGVAALRCTLMNPLTTPATLAALLQTLREHGQRILNRAS
ncbi:MAG: aminotransferase class V-fold PLP-dependent enzyme, partial [Planctomycetaceae bacterium]